MAKRKLGLGNKQNKKVKVEVSSTELNNEDKSDNQLLTVELTNEVNPDDPLSQLVGLWKTWKDSERSNELILNGIINECDRLLRNSKVNGGDEDIKINDKLYEIYSQSLSEISKFKPEEESIEWIEGALDRIEEGFEKFGGDNIRLKFSKCNIILNKIAIKFISKMTIDSKIHEFEGFDESFEDFINTWNEAIESCEESKDFSIFDEEWILEILNTFDDLLDIIDKFGTQINEVVDSDEEDEDGDNEAVAIEEAKNALEMEEFEISEDHPLFKHKYNDEYNKFWRENMLKYKENMSADVEKSLKRSVYEKLGQSYLMEAEEPIGLFNSYKYDREEEDEEETDPEMENVIEAARTEAIRLVELAIEHLKQTHDEEDPKTWVNIAEAIITYGNLLELDSKEQEEAYADAEKRLRRANNATHGKYQDILDSLVKQ